MKIHPISRKELWAAQAALFTAISLQIVAWTLTPAFTYGPHSVIVVTEVILAVMLGLTAGRRHLHRTSLYRTLSLFLLGLISVANVISLVLVAHLLITATAGLSGKDILVAALAIFITNIIVFALWYWEIDSPGLSGTKWSKHSKDFQFTQQDMKQEFENWQPNFVDYLYLSITNAINFAPADVKPLTTQAKCLMGVQSLISVFTLALVLARSISILGS